MSKIFNFKWNKYVKYNVNAKNILILLRKKKFMRENIFNRYFILFYIKNNMNNKYRYKWFNRVSLFKNNFKQKYINIFKNFFLKRGYIALNFKGTYKLKEYKIIYKRVRFKDRWVPKSEYLKKIRSY